jgi:hypothetical protein
MSEANNKNVYLWCDPCRRSFSYRDAPDADCPVCNTPMREMGKMSAVLRGLMATEMVASDLRTKHRQLVRMIWTRSGAGEQYFRVLEPDMTYSRFEARVTDLISLGAEEGWITIELPPAPSIDDSLYRIVFNDEERFVQELNELVEKSRKPRKHA